MKNLIDLKKLQEKYGENYFIDEINGDLIAINKQNNNLRINLTLYFKTLKKRFNEIN